MPLEPCGFFDFIEDPRLRGGAACHHNRIETTCHGSCGKLIHEPKEATLERRAAQNYNRIETTCHDRHGTSKLIHEPKEATPQAHAGNPASSCMGLLDSFADSFASRCQKVLEQLEGSLPHQPAGTIKISDLCLDSIDLTKCLQFRPLALMAPRHRTEDFKEDSGNNRAHSLASDAKFPLCRWVPWRATPEQRAEALAMASCALLPLSVGAMAGGVAMAQCPVGFDFNYSFPSMKSLPSTTIPELSLEGYQKSILVLTFIQGTGGLARMCVGDVFGGAYTLLLATLGYNSRTPGPAANWLKTYVLITFINGTMSSVSLVQDMLIHNYPIIAPFKLPLLTNLSHFVTLTVPGVSFLGAYFGWQYIKVQRRAVIEAQQRQLAMLMRMPPPPPLLPPLPAMEMQAVGFPGSSMGMKVPLAPVPEEQEED